MATISVSLPSDGTTADVADYNTPITTVVNAINGGLDNDNIKSAAAIDGSKLADKSVPLAKVNGGATAGVLKTDSSGVVSVGVPTTAAVVTVETTASATFTDLTTPGPAVTVTTGTMALVTVTADLSNGTINDYAVMGFAVSGATTIAATTASSLYNKASAAANNFRASYTKLVTGLTPGSNTFTAKYEIIVGGTGTFSAREITVIPL